MTNSKTLWTLNPGVRFKFGGYEWLALNGGREQAPGEPLEPGRLCLIGVELLEYESDLTADDRLTDYGTSTDRVLVLSADGSPYNSYARYGNYGLRLALYLKSDISVSAYETADA
jgi:hypothetical protein